MKLPVIRESYILNIIILLVSLFVSWFTLLFGLAHLIEGGERNPNIPHYEHVLGVTFCVSLCLIGIVFLVIAYVAIEGIVYKFKMKK